MILSGDTSAPGGAGGLGVLRDSFLWLEGLSFPQNQGPGVGGAGSDPGNVAETLGETGVPVGEDWEGACGTCGFCPVPALVLPSPGRWALNWS